MREGAGHRQSPGLEFCSSSAARAPDDAGESDWFDDSDDDEAPDQPRHGSPAVGRIRRYQLTRERHMSWHRPVDRDSQLEIEGCNHRDLILIGVEPGWSPAGT